MHISIFLMYRKPTYHYKMQHIINLVFVNILYTCTICRIKYIELNPVNFLFKMCFFFLKKINFKELFCVHYSTRNQTSKSLYYKLTLCFVYKLPFYHISNASGYVIETGNTSHKNCTKK